jgi:hypothetical protein
MKNSFLSILVTYLLLCSGCNTDKSLIKKNLNSRFTKFEIVEIRKDSANVFDACNMLLSTRINVSETNLNVIKAINGYYSGTSKMSPKEIILYIDSIENKLTALMTKFEELRFDRSENCYYVKYLLSKEENKIPKEEYFYINPWNKEVITRPYNWDEYLYKEKYDLLINESMKYDDDYYQLKEDFRGNN